MKLTYRPEIDGLRAIAVGAVILYHAQITIMGYQPFKGGFIGVDIFFVISGYLITSIILKELVTTGSFSFKHFYERRVRRILPVLLFVMLVSLPFAWVYLLSNPLVNFSKSILYSIGFSSNFYFHFQGKNYFQGGFDNPFLHTWSLSVEEQYYILFPIVLLITFKYFRKYIIHFLILGFFISLSSAEWGSRHYPSATFYFLHTRMWELLAGSILAYFEIKLDHRSKNKKLNLVLPGIGLVLIGYSILFFDGNILHPSFYTLSPIIGTCLIIWFSQKDELITKILSTKLFVGIGLISYSLYLWHYPVFCFNYFVEFTDGIFLKKIFLFIFIIILSLFSYCFIERPFRDKKIDFKKTVLFLLINFLFLSSFCIYSLNLKPHPLIKNSKMDREFMLNYNFQDFNGKKNIFIIGDSYAIDLFKLLHHNKNLNNKYYFYSSISDEITPEFDLDCLLDFIEKNNKICNRNSFNFFQTQYKNSDYIFFSERFSNFYLKPEFEKILEILKKDQKNFIIILDDINNADFLDIYLHRNQKIPDLEEFEKIFFKKKFLYYNKDLQKIKNKFIENDIKYLTRSELYCDYLNEKCPLIKNDKKLYFDYGHLTNYGAEYFSKKGNQIIDIIE